MKRIAVAIDVADEELDAQALRARAVEECGVGIVLNPSYADRMVLVFPDAPAPALCAALASFGVTAAAPESLCDVLCDPDADPAASAKKRLRLMFREFKSNPLYGVGLRGKDPADPVKLARKRRAKRFKEAFYESLSDFIAANPGLTYKDYWDADGRPYEKQWPEYRAAVRRSKGAADAGRAKRTEGGRSDG